MRILDGLLLLVLVTWSYIPNRYIPYWQVGALPFKATDVGVFLIFITRLVSQPFLPRRVYAFSPRLAFMRKATMAAFTYAAVTITWSHQETTDQLAMGYTLVGAIVCSQAALFVVNRAPTDLTRLLWRLSVFIALAGVCYWFQAVFDFGFRAVNYVELSEFGMQRLGGPLVNPARGHFMFLPALGFTIGQVFSKKVSKKRGLPVVAALLISIFGLGSRSALICLAVFALVLALSVKRSYRGLAIVLVVIFGAGAFSLVLLRAKTERLSAGDPARFSTYETSAAIFSYQGPLEHIFGAGYGRWWPWYLTDVEGGGAYATNRFVQNTPYGPTLFNPHSTFLIAAIELGLPGLFCFACLLVLLARTAWRCRFLSPSAGLFAAGVAATIPAFFTDCYLVGDVKQNFIWWLFVSGAVALQFTDEVRMARQRKLSAAFAAGNDARYARGTESRTSLELYPK